MLQDASGCFRMLQDASGCFRFLGSRLCCHDKARARSITRVSVRTGTRTEAGTSLDRASGRRGLNRADAFWG